MTTRDDNPHQHQDDDAFEAFLRGEDPLSAQLRGLEQPAPPPALEARIRAEAEQALRASRDAANDAEEKALVASPLGRWRAPLALAATVVIGVSLGLQWKGWHPDAPTTLSDALPAAAPPAAVQDPAALARLPELAAPAAPAPQAPEPQPAPSARQATLARDDAEQPIPPPPPPPPPPAPPASPASPAPPTPPAPAPLALPAPGAAAAAVGSFQRQGNPAMLAPDEVGGQARHLALEGRRSGERGAGRDAAALAERPRKGLALIGELLDLGLTEEARTTWRRLREEYPDYPVPPELQRRVDAALAGSDGR